MREIGEMQKMRKIEELTWHLTFSKGEFS